MNVTTMTMPRADARKAYIEYREALKESPSDEYKELAEAYRAISQGRALIDALDAFREAGLDERALPRLAIARADVRRIKYSLWDADRAPCFTQHPYAKSAQQSFILPPKFYSKGLRGDWSAVVPLIPPRFAPPLSQLTKYWILWQPEWQQAPRDKDPMLLRRVSRYLFAVVAAWDLSDVEMAVLRRRLV